MHPRRSVGRVPALTLIAALCLAAPAAAGGLRCSVGEVVIENLVIGKTYSLSKLANLPLTVTSTCDEPVQIAIEPLVPDATELRQGAEAIPDRRWATASPDTLDLAPAQSAAARMQLSIPDDPALMGRRFQVTFWTHSLPRAGELLAYGLKSRIIFTTAATRDSAEVQPTGDLSVSLLPAQVQFKHLAAGKHYRLEQLAAHPITVRNTSNHPVRVELHLLTAAASGTPLNPDDAELLDAAKVHLEPASITLAPGESRAVTGEVVMNGGRAGKGKNLVCVVAASVADEPVRTQIYSRLRTDIR